MADFLASFNFESETPTRTNDNSCASVEDMQERLRALLSTKVTPTRAEHVASTIEVKAAAQFHLSLSDSENEALVGLAGIDPSLGGVRSSVTAPSQDGTATIRTVAGKDALSNQSSHDPVLQKLVAKHLVNAISPVDSSNWVLGDVSRGTHGWSFTYACADSHKNWSHQTSKAQTKAVMGEYSQKELDPTLASRPAFDCRGSLIIDFSRNPRNVTIDYEHTPLHMTVAQLAESFKPPPRELGPGAIAQQQKTPKKSASEKKEKRKKKRAAAELNEDGTPVAKKKRKKKPSASKDQAGDGATPGDETGGDVQAANGSRPEQVASNITVTPAEATRRREVALGMLRDAGVEPDTLSADQFSLFANQAPDLQKQSLEMLKQYGAERLRIIQPNKDDSSSNDAHAAPSTSARGSRGHAAEPTVTTELAPKKGSRKSQGGASSKTDGTPRKMAKSRLSCLQCKSRKVKDRPSCAECEAQGSTCEYPPQKPRNRKSAATITLEDDEAEEEEDEPEEIPLDQAAEQTQNEVEDMDSQHVQSVYPQVPVANMLSQPGDTSTPEPPQAPDLFRSTSTRPQVHHQQTITTSSGLVLPAGHLYDKSSQPNPLLQPPSHSPELSRAMPGSPDQRKRQSKGSSSSRRSLPVSAPHQPQAAPSSSHVGWSRSPALQDSRSPLVQQQQLAEGRSVAGAANAGRSVQSPHMRHSPAQNHGIGTAPQIADSQRSKSRQGQRGARPNTPQNTQVRSRGRGPPPIVSHAPMDDDAATRQAAANMTELATFSSSGRPAAAESSNGRINYEPYSQQKPTSDATTGSFPSYDYSQNSNTMNMTPSQMFNASQAQYGQGSRSGRTSAGVPNSGGRGEHAGQSGRSGLDYLNQRNQPAQNYPSYPSQVSQQQGTQAGVSTSNNWFGFGNMQENGRSSYSWPIPDQPWTGMQ